MDSDSAESGALDFWSVQSSGARSWLWAPGADVAAGGAANKDDWSWLQVEKQDPEELLRGLDASLYRTLYGFCVASELERKDLAKRLNLGESTLYVFFL